MNKTLTITAIALVAVVMGMSAITSAMAQGAPIGQCPKDFNMVALSAGNPELDKFDRNNNSFICAKSIPPEADIFVDDVIAASAPL